ncbi:MAG: lytic murein transglycosylase B [Gammaproteobacteria bacterium]|nr:lytic murein transglycosylase B [Gammaproteobacteria bacterium]
MQKRLTTILLSVLFFLQPVYANTTSQISFGDRPEVRTFIQKMVKEHQFKEKDLTTLFNNVTIRPIVINKLNAPLESRPWNTYQLLFVTETRIRKGVDFWNQYHDALAMAEQKYGVPASIIVATIGIETKYGLHTGEYPVIDALTNIGFSASPRAPFFRRELEEFLLLTREQHLNPLKVMGSYAGAIGQPQFMPSSYRHYAVSFTGHSSIDLSHNELDVIASIANYYKLHGWETDQPVAIPASLINKNFQFFFGKKNELKMISRSTFAEYGIDPNKILVDNVKYKVIELQSFWGNEYWLGFHNFDVIKRYNSSDLYAMAVFQLSHYISTLREKLNAA